MECPRATRVTHLGGVLVTCWCKACLSSCLTDEPLSAMPCLCRSDTGVIKPKLAPPRSVPFNQATRLELTPSVESANGPALAPLGVGGRISND